MKTSDFYLKPSSSKINESIEKKFGDKLDLANYTIDQLNQASNLIESKIASHKRGDFNATLDSDEFHKLTFMKDAVETALTERAVSKAQQKAAGAALAAKRGNGEAKGASKEMSKMSTKELEKFAGTKHKGLPNKKKKMDESMQTMSELAHHHAKHYAECYTSGMLEHAMHHKAQCEACGGSITHGKMGECYMSHAGMAGGGPVRIEIAREGTMGAGVGAGIGAMVGGPVGAAAGGALGSMAENSKNNDGNLANNAKPYDKVTRGDVIAGRLGKDEMGGKKNKKVDEIGDTPKGRAALGSYINKAVANKGMNDRYSAGKPNGDKASDKVASQRASGIKMAVNKLTRESTKAKPDFLDMDKKETMKKAISDKKKSVKENMNPYEGHEAGYDQFVNGNHANFKGRYNDDFDAATENFIRYLKKKGVTVDNIDHSGDPVIVAMSHGKMVAWYDLENAHGYLDQPVANPKNNYVSEARRNDRMIRESYLRFIAEGEEGKAELVMAVKNMVDKFTGWSEDIAKMQAQTAMEMADEIRDEMGIDQAEAFTQAVSPALDAAFQAVKSAREALNGTVGSMTGSAPAAMGATPPAPGGDMGPDMGGDMGADMGGEEPDLGAEDDIAATDATPPEGRLKREGIERHRRITQLLAGR